MADTELTAEEKAQERIAKAVDAATNDEGMTTIAITIQGEGRIAKGEGFDTFEEGDTCTVPRATAEAQIARGWASPKRPAKTSAKD